MVATRAHQPPLRLTRRGRAVVVLFFVLLASMASAVLFTTASRADNAGSGPLPMMVVQPHDTLWSIAGRAAPRRDPYAAMAEIQRLNGMHDYVVRPGDVLVVPREH
jgi:LysM domain